MDDAPEGGARVPADGDAEREALIDRCVQLHVSLGLSEQFYNRHAKELAGLHAAALRTRGAYLRRTDKAAFDDTQRQQAVAMEILRRLGLTDDEITRRLQARHEECAYPIFPDCAPRAPLGLRLLRRCGLFLARWCRKLGARPPAILLPKGGQRDLFH
jgi:hypothetical protein